MIFEHVEEIVLADVKLVHRKSTSVTDVVHGQFAGMVNLYYGGKDKDNLNFLSTPSLLDNDQFKTVYGKDMGDVESRKCITFVAVDLENKKRGYYSLGHYDIVQIHVQDPHESLILFFRDFERAVAVETLGELLEKLKDIQVATEHGFVDTSEYSVTIEESYGAVGMQKFSTHRSVTTSGSAFRKPAGFQHQPSSYNASNYHSHGWGGYYSPDYNTYNAPKKPTFFMSYAKDDGRIIIPPTDTRVEKKEDVDANAKVQGSPV